MNNAVLQKQTVEFGSPFSLRGRLNQAIAVGSAITRSPDPNRAIAQFQQEINCLTEDVEVASWIKQPALRLYSNAPWAAIDELSGCRG